MAWIANTIELLRKIDRLMTADTDHSSAIALLKERIAKLESDQALLLAEAKSAAASAASVMAGHHMTDLARRVGALEERTKDRTDMPSTRRLTNR